MTARDNKTNEKSGGQSRAFTVRGKRSPHKTYTFTNFDSARQGKTLFQSAGATLAEKKTLYDELVLLHEETTLRTARLAHRGVIVIGVPIAEVPIHFLTVNDAWCRTKLVDWNHIADMSMDFHAKSLSVPSVAVRCEYDRSGRLIDVIFSITDGVHRTVTIREKGHTHVQVSVQLVDTVREEAEISSDCNYGRRAHSNVDIMKNRIASEEERAMDLKALVEAHGFKLSSQLGTRVWPEIGAFPSLERALKRYGEAVLVRVLELLSDPAFVQWHGKPITVGGDILDGFALYVEEFEKPGFIHSAMTTHMMQNTTPVLVTDFAGRVGKPEAAVVFNRVMCPNAKDLGSQDGRGVRIATALVDRVADLFKPGKRPTTNYHKNFKKAFELFYTSSPTKMAELEMLRRACSRKGMPDYWWSKKNGDLTR